MSSPSSPYISEVPKKSWWDSLFGSAPAPASSPAPASTSTPVGGRHRRKHTLKAGRRHRKGGDDGPKPVKFTTPAEYGRNSTGPKWEWMPGTVRKRKGGRRTHRGKKHSRK